MGWGGVGCIGISTSFVLFSWGALKNGRPRKWLLHITGGPLPAQEDQEAAEMRPGSSTLAPTIALQYYYDWGHMMRTGAIEGLVRGRPPHLHASAVTMGADGATADSATWTAATDASQPRLWGAEQLRGDILADTGDELLQTTMAETLADAERTTSRSCSVGHS